MFALIAPLALAAAPAAIPARVTRSAPETKAAPAARTAPARKSAPDSKSAKSAAASKPLPVIPWWEKVTVTMDGQGKTKSCKYESSTKSQPSDDCALFSGMTNASDGDAQTPASQRNQYTTLTFERRFSPGAAVPTDVPLATGDTLLGREIMVLAIDSHGKVSNCKVVATSGDLPPDYSCNDASAERFALAGKGSDPREGFFTIRIYGHSEHLAMRQLPGLRV